MQYDFGDGRGLVLQQTGKAIGGEARVAMSAYVEEVATVIVSGAASVYQSAQVLRGGWICDRARVFGNARVSWDGCVSHEAEVSGNVTIVAGARIAGRAHVSGEGTFAGHVRIRGTMRVTTACAQLTRSDGYVFTIAPDEHNVLVICAGCRYFTLGEAHRHWERTRAGTPLGRETMVILDVLRKLAAIHYPKARVTAQPKKKLPSRTLAAAAKKKRPTKKKRRMVSGR